MPEQCKSLRFNPPNPSYLMISKPDSSSVHTKCQNSVSSYRPFLMLSNYFDAWHCRILVVLGSETIEHLSAPIAGTPNYQSFDREENASRPPQYDAPQQQYQQNQQNQPPPYGSNNVMSPNAGQQVRGLLHSSLLHVPCLSSSPHTPTFSPHLFIYLQYSSYSLSLFVTTFSLTLISLPYYRTESGNSQLEASTGETLFYWQCIVTTTTLQCYLDSS